MTVAFSFGADMRWLALLPLAALFACASDQPDVVPGFTPDDGAASAASSSSRASVASSSAAVGTGGGSSSGGLVVSVDAPASALDLASSMTLDVTITPTGQIGPALLSTSDLAGTGITASFGDASVALDGVSPTTTSLSLATASDATPGVTSIVVRVATASDEGTTSIDVSVTSAITITIPSGVDALGGTVDAPITDAFGPYPTRIRAPVAISAADPVIVRFFNADTVAHEVHAEQAGRGFGHGNVPIPPGAMDPLVREINAAGTYDYYLHDQQVPIVVGRIVVE